MRFLLLLSSIARVCAFEGTGLHSQLATVVDAQVSHAQTSTKLADLPALSSLRGHRTINFMLRGSGLRVKQPDDDFGSDSDDGGFGGVIVGFLLWAFIPICLWNNERIAIKQYKMQYKAEKYALIIDNPDKEPLAGPGGMEGRIVYVTGTAKVDDTAALVDSEYKSVKSEGKVKLRRIVQMYQWVEHEHKEKNRQGHERTTYTYSQSWHDSEQSVMHDNSKRNPSMKLHGTCRQKRGYRAMYDAMAGVGDLCPCVPHENFKLGQYYLGEYVIREMLNWKMKDDITEDMVRRGPLTAGKELTQDGNFWYLSGRPSSPQTGDMRIQFEELIPGPLTVVGVLSKTKSGWTFVPVLRADAAQVGDNAAAEFGSACCPCLFRVKELHYGLDEEGDAEVMQELPNRPVELKRTEMAAFKRSDTSIAADYEGSDDIDDLCCVGCCGVQIVQLMRYLGLEEEFLAVSEQNQDLHKVMKDESSNAASRHHAARVAGLVGLCCASSCIISPIIALLNYNWLSSLLVGWWLGAIISCCACVTSLVAFLVIVSAAWIAHRPWMAMTGIVLASSLIAASYMLVSAQMASTTAAPAF